MPITLIKNARLLSNGTELSATSLAVSAGRILSVGEELSIKPNQTIDLNGDYLAPGLIDIQLNGGYSRYFSNQPNAETLEEMTRACLEHATPYYYATLITSPIEAIWQGIEAVRTAMQSDPHLLGMHLEGPFLNAKRRGAHKAAYIQPPTDELLDELIARGRGVIKMLTIAPEQFTPAQIQRLRAAGIQLSLGHSDATWEQANACFDLGVDIVTHLYNAMSPLTHRAPGLVGAALADERVFTPLILDGRHCHPAAARLAYQAKGSKFILLTDAAVLGRRLERITWDGLNAALTEDGFYINEDGNLAGAAISMPEAVRNACLWLGVPVPEAVAMATDRVAQAIGREGELGRIAAGYPAAFTVFSPDLTHWRTLTLISEGGEPWSPTLDLGAFEGRRAALG